MSDWLVIETAHSVPVDGILEIPSTRHRVRKPKPEVEIDLEVDLNPIYYDENRPDVSSLPF